MDDHDNKSARLGHHDETIHPLPKGGSARIRPRKTTSVRSVNNSQRIDSGRAHEHSSSSQNQKQSKASETHSTLSSTDTKNPQLGSQVSDTRREAAARSRHTTPHPEQSLRQKAESRTMTSESHKAVPRQRNPKSVPKNRHKKSNVSRKKKTQVQIFQIDLSKLHRLRPLLLRYIMPLAVITLILSLMTLIDVPGKIATPAYSMEDFMNRTPYHYKGSYNRDFNDLNDLQLTAAIKLGIPPADTREEAALSKRLVPIKCGDVISIDPLTHSQALLVPKAHDLLEQIGSTFMGRLAEDKLPLYRIILTSGTRTREDVGNLRRRNGNASENSTHMYGTTFDISWRRFDKVDPNDPRSLDPGELKHLLAIVLKDFHDKGYCYIKHERKQACFHITTRP